MCMLGLTVFSDFKKREPEDQKEIKMYVFLLLFPFRMLMEELVNFMERVPKAQSATCWKNKEIQR